MKPVEMWFLGTGGGRFVMVTQRRRTAGLRLIWGDVHIHVDPGPGGLIFSNWSGLSPQKLDAIFVTHCHPDHYCDAEVLIEGMTRVTTKRRGVLAASRSVLQGVEDIGPSISTYHQGLVERVVALEPNVSFDVREVAVRALRAEHSDPATVGLRLEFPDVGSIGYTSDTAYFDGVSDGYRSVRLLILCTMRPRGAPLPLHLSVDDALKILVEARPRCAVLTHFGMKMLNAGPEVEAEYLEAETGIPTVAARDGMRVILSDVIEVRGPRKREEPRVIEA